MDDKLQKFNRPIGENLKERANPLLRFLDRYFGIPLIFLLRLFSKKKTLPRHFDKIALLKAAGIGDTVLLSAVIEDIKQQYPRAELVLFTGKSNSAMASYLKGITIVPLPMTKPLACLKLIRHYSFDVWFDFDPWPRINALLTFFSRSSFRCGFKTKNQYRAALYDRTVNHRNDQHELENYRELVRSCGISCSRFPYFETLQRPAPTSTIAFQMFSGGSQAVLKQWPQEKWRLLAERLIQKGFSIVLTGGPAEANACEEFIQSTKLLSIQNYAGKFPLSKMSSFLCSCACLVSVDTGLHHLAAALHCPVVSLHGPTSPKRWGALGPHVVAITPDLDYHPCISLGFENTCKKASCMQKISVDQVESALLQLIPNFSLKN